MLFLNVNSNMAIERRPHVDRYTFNRTNVPPWTWLVEGFFIQDRNYTTVVYDYNTQTLLALHQTRNVFLPIPLHIVFNNLIQGIYVEKHGVLQAWKATFRGIPQKATLWVDGTPHTYV